MPSSYTIGDHFEHFVKEQVEGGSYTSASEVIRDGLRLLEEDQKRRQAVIDGLRGEIEKGRRSGKGINLVVLPPGALVAIPVQLLMVFATKRNGKLVADLAA